MEKISRFFLAATVLALLGGVIAWQSEEMRHPLPTGYVPAENTRRIAREIALSDVQSIVIQGASYSESWELEVSDEQEKGMLLNALRYACWPPSSSQIKDRGLSLRIHLRNGEVRRLLYAGLQPERGFGPEFTRAVELLEERRTAEFRSVLSESKVKEIRLSNTLVVQPGKAASAVVRALSAAKRPFDWIGSDDGIDVNLTFQDGSKRTFWISTPDRLSSSSYMLKRDPELPNPPLPQPLWRLVCKAELLHDKQVEEERKHPETLLPY